ncbi:MAG: DNA methyltransferase [Candidatus Competibacteraceae bacterium]
MPFGELKPKSEINTNDWHGWTQDGIDWHVYRGDAYQVLTSLTENAYNCIVTSPPYYCLRDYGVEGQIGRKESVQEYVDAISSIMDEARRVLTQNGVLFLNIGDTYYSGKGESQGKDRKSRKRRFGLRPVDKSGGLGIGIRPKSIIGIPWRVAIEMSRRGWILRSPIIWHREYRLPEAVKDRPRRSYEQEWTPDITPENIIEKFFSEFLINELEREKIFNSVVPEDLFKEPIFGEQKVTWQDLRSIIGDPPDDRTEGGAALGSLELREVGPAKEFCYEPAKRLNIITGDNSLGKTFLLETMWWALTGEWLKYPASPRREVAKTKPRISFSIKIII